MQRKWNESLGREIYNGDFNVAFKMLVNYWWSKLFILHDQWSNKHASLCQASHKKPDLWDQL